MQSSCISGLFGKFGLLLIKVWYVILALLAIALHVSPDCTTYVVVVLAFNTQANGLGWGGQWPVRLKDVMWTTYLPDRKIRTSRVNGEVVHMGNLVTGYVIELVAADKLIQ